MLSVVCAKHLNKCSRVIKETQTALKATFLFGLSTEVRSIFTPHPLAEGGVQRNFGHNAVR